MQRFLAVSAVAIAIAANWSAFGFGLTAQSENNNIPPSPYCEPGTIIMKKLDTTDTPGAVFII